MAACRRWWSGVCIATLSLGFTKRGCCALHMQSECKVHALTAAALDHTVLVTRSHRCDTGKQAQRTLQALASWHTMQTAARMVLPEACQLSE